MPGRAHTLETCPGQDNYGRQCFIKWTVCSCLLNSLVINILVKRILGHVLQLHRVSFRSRGEVRNINSVKALLCFQQGSPGNCSASLLCCVRVGSRFCYGGLSGRGILEELCTCFCTGCILKISLGTCGSSTKDEFFPDVSITSLSWLLPLDSGEFCSQQVFTRRFCLQNKALCGVLLK